jgi:hypothetical protein
MQVHFGKFVHTETGKTIMSVLLGLGLATLFRTVCKDKNCLSFHAPPLNKIKGKIYRAQDKCVQYVPVPTKCSLHAKTITFA